MERRLRREEVVTIEVLHERGCSNRQIARQLGIDEKAVRYRLRRAVQGQSDGRADKPFAAEVVGEAIAQWMAEHAEGGVNLAALHEHLRSEYGYGGSYKSVQRYVGAKFARPRLRVRRRVETPPGAQGQADWAEFRGVRVGGEALDLYAFHLTLSWSRMDAVVWSERKDELAWLDVHNGALRRLGGVPAVLRIDNEKTAIVRGAGAWGEIHETYRCYAAALRFHVDACAPRSPQAKGKVERKIRDQRRIAPGQREWSSLEELQAWSDAQMQASAQRRICPANGERVWEAWEQERAVLTPLPALLPEPFDVVVQRRVALDCTVRFEGSTYSVPFVYADREVEVRGCARVVQIWSPAGVIAQWPRRSRGRLWLDPAHYEGAGDERVAAPQPLGRMGRRLAEIAAMAPERRPIDLYAALAAVAR